MSFVNIIKLGLKLTFSVAALWFVFSQLDWQALAEQWQRLSLILLVSLFAINALGHMAAGFRFHYYCQKAAITLSQRASMRLYFIGLFLNHLLPGGIGGDGYVVMRLKRDRDTSIAGSIRLLLSARASGLLALIIFATLCVLLGTHVIAMTGWPLVLICLMLSFCCYSLAAHYMLKEAYHTQLVAVVYSLIVQGSFALIIYILLMGHIPDQQLLDYTALLLLSSILVLIPISFGGLGLRELGLFYAAGMLGFNAELGVAICLLHYALNLMLSVVGGYFYLMNNRKQ